MLQPKSAHHEGHEEHEGIYFSWIGKSSCLLRQIIVDAGFSEDCFPENGRIGSNLKNWIFVRDQGEVESSRFAGLPVRLFFIGGCTP